MVFVILMVMSLGATLSLTAILSSATKSKHELDLHFLLRSRFESDRIRKHSSGMSSQPRVVYMMERNFPSHLPRILQDDLTLHVMPGEEASANEQLQIPDDGCVPAADWQTKSFPNCNIVHEFDLRSAGTNVGTKQNQVDFEETLSFLGQGWFRHAWKLQLASNESIVLKTLRLERDFLAEYYELHRRDALAMERLTHSAFVMNVYGYCGQSALNELADFPHGLNSLEKFDRNLRGYDGPEILLLKLQVASSIALGVAHLHEIDSDNVATMVHYDLNPRNVAIVKSGIPKLNDFNIAEFLRINPETNKTCGFPSRLHEPWWRAPEEVEIGANNTLDEKVDVYALGNLLFHILTTTSPRGKMKIERMEETRQVVLKGVPPILPHEYDKSKDKVIKAFRKAMDMCFEVNSMKRGSARQVAVILMQALSEARDIATKGKS